MQAAVIFRDVNFAHRAAIGFTNHVSYVRRHPSAWTAFAEGEKRVQGIWVHSLLSSVRLMGNRKRFYWLISIEFTCSIPQGRLRLWSLSSSRNCANWIRSSPSWRRSNSDPLPTCRKPQMSRLNFTIDHEPRPKWPQQGKSFTWLNHKRTESK